MKIFSLYWYFNSAITLFQLLLMHLNVFVSRLANKYTFSPTWRHTHLKSFVHRIYQQDLDNVNCFIECINFTLLKCKYWKIFTLERMLSFLTRNDILTSSFQQNFPSVLRKKNDSFCISVFIQSFINSSTTFLLYRCKEEIHSEIELTIYYVTWYIPTNIRSRPLLALRPTLVLLLTKIFQYRPCLRNTMSFIPPRYRKSRATSHYTTFSFICMLFSILIVDFYCVQVFKSLKSW